MQNKLFEILQATSFEILGLFFIFFALSFFWEKIFSYFSLKTYQSKQRLHENEIPRIAGIIIYIFF